MNQIESMVAFFIRSRSAFLAIAILLLPPACSQGDLDKVVFRSEQVTEKIYMLQGAGGNVALSIGDDGILMVDSEFAELADKLRAATAEISPRPVRLVINTHWHFDHVGGNEMLRRNGAEVVAHENALKRMSTDQYIAAKQLHVPAVASEALPTTTIEKERIFQWNGESVRVFHVKAAHTDGDVVVHFTGSDVIHAGDLYTNKMYPFIDASSGGSIDGVIAAADRMLELAGPRTKIIPGHGPVSGVAELQWYRNMLATVRDRCLALMAAGKSDEEIVAAKPTRDFDAAQSLEVESPDKWVRIIASALRASR